MRKHDGLTLCQFATIHVEDGLPHILWTVRLNIHSKFVDPHVSVNLPRAFMPRSLRLWPYPYKSSIRTLLHLYPLLKEQNCDLSVRHRSRQLYTKKNQGNSAEAEISSLYESRTNLRDWKHVLETPSDIQMANPIWSQPICSSKHTLFAHPVHLLNNLSKGSNHWHLEQPENPILSTLGQKPRKHKLKLETINEKQTHIWKTY